jgi:hypothetical protein
MQHSPGPLVSTRLTTVVVQFVAGDDDALRVVCRLHGARMESEARRRLRRACVAPSQFGADDAVNAALSRIHQARTRGQLAWVKNGDDFGKAFSCALKHVIRNMKDQIIARRRGGTGSSRLSIKDGRDANSRDGAGHGHGFRRAEADLDQLQSGLPSAGREALESLEFKMILDRLAPVDRQVLTMIVDGHSTTEIAGHLERAPRTIERHRANIRRILGEIVT